MAQRTMPTKRERREMARQAKLEARRRARRMAALRTWGIPLAVVAAIALVAVLTTLGGGGTSRTADEVTVDGPPRTAMLAEGERFPSFAAPGHAGGPVSWKAGAPSMISIWAPWCPVCREEMPIVDRMAEEFPGVEVVSVATAVNDRPGPTVGAFVADADLTIPVALDDDAGTLARAMGIQGFPTSYFVDGEGRVLAAAEGLVEEEALRGMLESMTG